MGRTINNARSAVRSIGVVLPLLVLGSTVLPAQTFRSIPELTFTRQFGAPNPLPQTLTVASAGAAFRFNVTATTSTGGAWLSVTGCAGSCDTPHYLTVSVVASVALAAGTYDGQIVLKEHFSNATSITIPVTLTIAAAGQAELDNLPGQVSFSLKTNGLTPPSQPIQIRNAGPGALNWTSTSSTADGGAWLTMSASNGTAPSTISVSLVKANLPGAGATAGTFIGQIRITANGRSTTIPVSVIVGPAVFSQINAINFAKLFGGADPLPQVVTVTSTGANFRSNVTSSTALGGDWLTVTGCAGSCDTPRALTVTVNPSVSLAAGTYTGQVVIREHFSGTMAMTVPVTLTVGSPGNPLFDNVPGQLSFSMKTNGATPVSQDVQIRNGGGGALPWTLAAITSDGSPWLTTSAVSGSAPSFVTIGITVAALPDGGLTPGVFTGQLLFQNASGNVTIPISVVVGDVVFSQLNAIHFTKLFAGANPLPQTLTIASTGANFRANVTAKTATGGNWLSVTGCAGSCDTPHVIYAAINAGPTLPVGTYTGQIVVTEHFTGTMAMTIPVTLTVNSAGAAFFDNMPGQMSFFLKTAGAAPPGQDIQVRNGGSGALNWTLAKNTSDGGAWLNVSSSSGTAPATVRVTIVPSALPNLGLVAGTFTGELVFDSSSGRVTVPVSVSVGAAVFRQANAISFVKPFSGADPLPQVLTIASTGTNFRANVQVSTATGGDWLSVTGCAGSCDTPHVVRAIVTAPLPLAAGTYTGQIIFTEHFSGTMAMTIPVTLTVAPNGTPFFDNVQGHMGFSMMPNTGNPANLQVELRNGGSGSVAWTLETSTADGAAWLNVDAPSGNTAAGATSLITASVTAASLPDLGLVAGTFTGQLLFKSTAGNLTIPVSVVVGANVFTQLGPLHFSRGFGAANPLPQVLSLTSTAANFRSNTVEFSGNGGDWLSISGCAGSCDTPTNLTASITAGAGLAAGTYTGEIIVTEHFTGTMAMTVPVILTITGGPVPSSVTVVSGTPQSALINTAFANPLSVIVRDGGSNPLSGITVTFTPPVSGASGTFAGGVNTAVTNGAGIATSTTFTANGIAGGPYTVAATVSGVATPANFSLTNTNCSFSLSPPSASPNATGGAASVNVIATPGCPWTASSNSAFLTINSGASGNGNGTVNYTVSNNIGTQRTGTITIAGLIFTVTQAGAGTPVVEGMTPTSGTGAGAGVLYTFTFSDTDGFADLNILNILINNAIDGRSACYMAFVRSTGQLLLVNDAGEAGGPFAGSVIIPGSGTASNSQCTIDAAASSVNASGNDVSLTLSISFTGGFGGRRIMYLAARDLIENNSGWHARGVWTVPFTATPTAVVSMTPERTQGNSVLLSTVFSDVNGFADLNVLNILINNGIDGRNACYVAYVRPSHNLLIVNDAGEAGGPFPGSIPIPGAGLATNSQCTINATGSSVSENGNTVTLTLNITFTAGFKGDRIVYAAARDAAENNSGWQAMATITVP